MSDRTVIVLSLVAIVNSLVSIVLSVAARRRYTRAMACVWLESATMDPEYTPPSASLNPQKEARL